MALSLTGCISNSPGLQNIFLTSFQRQNSNLTTASAGVQLRVGYFGICLCAGTETSCYISAMTSFDKLLSQLNWTTSLSDEDLSQVTGLLSVARTLQKKIYVPLLAAAGSFFLLGLTFFTLLKWATKRPTANLTISSTKRLQFNKQGSSGSIWTSVALSTASAVSATECTAVLEFWTVNVPESSIIVSAGTTLQVLRWIIVGLSVLFALAINSTLRATEAGTLPGPGGNGLPPKPIGGLTIQPGGRFPAPPAFR